MNGWNLLSWADTGNEMQVTYFFVLMKNGWYSPFLMRHVEHDVLLGHDSQQTPVQQHDNYGQFSYNKS